MSRALTKYNHDKYAPTTTHKLSKNGDLVIADISFSMTGSSGHGGRSCWDCLKEALKAQQGRIQIMAFSTRTYECASADELPRPIAGTNLTGALDLALTLEPMHVLVISDGQPDNAQSALDSAAKLSELTIVDVLFIGPDSDVTGIEFMQELAKVGCGRFVKYDLAATKGPLLLTQKVSALLALPAPAVITL